MSCRTNERQEHGSENDFHDWDIYPPTLCNQGPWSCAQASVLGARTMYGSSCRASGIGSVPELGQVCSRKFELPSPKQRTTKKENYLVFWHKPPPPQET